MIKLQTFKKLSWHNEDLGKDFAVCNSFKIIYEVMRCTIKLKPSVLKVNLISTAILLGTAIISKIQYMYKAIVSNEAYESVELEYSIGNWELIELEDMIIMIN